MKEELLETLNKLAEQKEDNNIDSLKDLLQLVDNIIENPDSLANFELNDLVDNNIITIEELAKSPLSRYKKYAKSKFLQLTSENKEEIKNYFNSYKTIILARINEHETILNSKIKPINSLILKIQNDEKIDKTEFLEYSKLLKENITDAVEYINFLKKLSLFVCSIYEKQLQEEDNIIKITNLERSDLEKLFQEFNLDLNNLEEKDQERLLTYGNLNNIRSILQVLKENGIVFNLKLYSKQIVNILIASTQSNVLYIINTIKADYENQEGFDINYIFNKYIRNIHTIFTGNEKKLERKKVKDKEPKNPTEPPIPGGPNDTILGNFANYKTNREYLIEQGANISIVASKCPDILTRSSKTLKRSFEALLSYGIKKESIFNTLSSLLTSTPLDVIDQYIEAGFYEYVKDNLTRVREGVNPKILYQMINAKKSGKKSDEIFGTYTGVKREGLHIKSAVLSEFLDNELLFEPEYHDEDLESMYKDIDFSNLRTIDELVYNNPFIKILEENYKQDDYTYKFNEIIISRYKVLRYFAILLKHGYNNFTALKYAVFKNTIITKNEYDVILEGLNRLLKIKNPIEEEIPQIIYQNFFIRFLDSNFLNLEDNKNYNFNGIVVSRDSVIRNFANYFIRKEVMPNPLETLRRAIIGAFRSDYNRSPETNEYYTVNECLNKASEGIKDMGRRL